MDDENNPLKLTKAESAGEVAAIGLNAIPIVGGVLAGAANSVIAKRQNQRLEEFLQDLAQTLNEMHSRMNKDFIQSEDFADLAEDIFSKASETRQKEKLDAFKAIFLGTIFAQRPNYDEANEVSELVHRWQKRHIVLLSILANPVVKDKEMNNTVGEGGGFSISIDQILKRLLPSWDSDQVERTWKDLYDAGIHRTQGTRGMMTDRGIYQLEERLTKFGQKVVNYLQLP